MATVLNSNLWRNGSEMFKEADYPGSNMVIYGHLKNEEFQWSGFPNRTQHFLMCTSCNTSGSDVGMDVARQLTVQNQLLHNKTADVSMERGLMTKFTRLFLTIYLRTFKPILCFQTFGGYPLAPPRKLGVSRKFVVKSGDV